MNRENVVEGVMGRLVQFGRSVVWVRGLTPRGRTTNRRRIQKAAQLTEEEKEDILLGLMSLPKATRGFVGLYLSGYRGNYLRIQRTILDEPEWLPWCDAQMMLDNAQKGANGNRKDHSKR